MVSLPPIFITIITPDHRRVRRSVDRPLYIYSQSTIGGARERSQITIRSNYSKANHKDAIDSTKVAIGVNGHVLS